ncbi:MULTISPECIES: PACE efflux transporter [Halomonadaceae]|uniref:Putative membrane protein n=1 Tax=Onishia taeanensis TaxID=284577 RepID=A0A328XLY9_9GAMM|nr:MULTISPECIES: PACE efflux transporter [Halomonas]RAR60842.1 putative membrane protein [Halomonas taeanensis]
MRSVKERLLHSALFEAGGLVLVTPLANLVSGHGLGKLGTLGVALATVAMGWNLIWNRLFDHWVPSRRRSVFERLAQALGFEAGLVVLTLPGVAWWLEIGLAEALWLDIGFVVFFLAYGLIFNTLFDRAMRRHLARGGSS